MHGLGHVRELDLDRLVLGDRLPERLPTLRVLRRMVEGRLGDARLQPARPIPGAASFACQLRRARVGATGFAGAAGLAAGGVEGAAAAGFGGTGGAGGEAGFSAAVFSVEILESDWTEPEAVACTPPGTAGLSAVGFGSPSGGGEEGDLVSSGIALEGTNLRRAGFRRER